MFPNIISILLSLYPLNCTFVYLNKWKDVETVDSKDKNKILLIWLYYLFFENIRFLLDYFPIIRLTSQLSMLYFLVEKEKYPEKILIDFTIAYNKLTNYLNLKYSRPELIEELEDNQDEKNE